MKFLIVNGDDFGASRGTSRGILEAQSRGILTSTSLLVNTVWSQEAADLSRDVSGLSVGLHVDLVKRTNVTTANSRPDLREEIDVQIGRFRELMGRLPSHLDSHHNTHRDPSVLPHFLSAAKEYGLPLREHSRVRYFSKFSGQWGGETHLEQISCENLARMLETEIPEGITELSCHPGYVDPDYSTGYSKEREAELRTLCDPRIRNKLAELSIQLISYHDLVKLGAGTPA